MAEAWHREVPAERPGEGRRKKPPPAVDHDALALRRLAVRVKCLPTP